MQAQDLALGVVALGVAVAHTVVRLKAAHGYLCVPGPVHGPLVDVGRPNDNILYATTWVSGLATLYKICTTMVACHAGSTSAA